MTNNENSLREEIRQIIEYAQRDAVIYVDNIAKGESNAILPNPKDISQEILSKIEKRIDSMISEELHRLDDSGKAEINIDCYNEIFLRDHVIEKLKQIKEMLK